MVGVYHGAVPPLVSKFGVAADVDRCHRLELCPQCFCHCILVLPTLLVRPSFELVSEAGVVITTELVDVFAFDVLS